MIIDIFRLPPKVIPVYNILIYCDDVSTNFQDVPAGLRSIRPSKCEFGLSIMRNSVRDRPHWPLYNIEFINRNYLYNKDGSISSPALPVGQKNKITKQLLSRYDQVWFFGQHLAAFNHENRDAIDGDIDSELDDEEIAVIRNWMDSQQGGVLITGDHSNLPQNPTDLIDQSLLTRATTLNLGRALGYKIPRAKQMRVWEDGPGAYEGVPLGTHVVDTSGDTNMNNMPQQEDDLPQQIRARTFSTKYRMWMHPLFILRSGNPVSSIPGISVFPDHGHEGALTTPANFSDRVDGQFNESLWPYVILQNGSRIQILPETVAIGVNRSASQFENPVALVACYDGHQVGVGRIVADSTWHHYVNVNLHGFLDAAGRPTQTLDVIVDYYENLIWYLTPPRKRVDLLKMFVAIARNSPSVREVESGIEEAQGKAALRALRHLVAPELIDDLVKTALDWNMHNKMSVDLDPNLIARDLLFGSVLSEVSKSRQDIGEMSPEYVAKCVQWGLARAANRLRKFAIRRGCDLIH